MVYLVVELVDAKHKGYLWIGFWAGMATAVAGALLRIAIISYQTENAIDGLNQAIRDLRSYILGLKAASIGE